MQKITAHISPLFHRGKEHIKVNIPNTPPSKELIKRIRDRKWSRTHCCWYIPKTTEAYNHLKQLFQVEIEKGSPEVISQTEKQDPSPPKTEKSSGQNLSVKVLPEHDFRVKVFIPWQRKGWVELIKTMPNRAWNMEEKYWSVPKTKEVLELLKNKFGTENLIIGANINWKVTREKLENPYELEQTKKALKEFLDRTSVTNLPKPKEEQTKISEIPSEIDENLFQITNKDGEDIKKFTGEKIYIEKENERWLRVFVPYDKKGWIETLRNVNGRTWNLNLRCWVVPNVKESYRLLKKFIGMENLKFLFEISADIPENYHQPRKNKPKSKKLPSKFEKLNEKQKAAVQKMEERLLLERKSIWTIKAYKNNLSGLFSFYKNLHPEEITKNQLSQYLLYLIRFQKIAESTQNQIINAVKAYWERVLGRGKEWIDIPRPKKPKTMPNVLSTDEVVKIINAPKNLKHKLALLLIYSAGLRRSELLNLLKKDINIKRRSIHIKAAKGKKDRYVVLAETAVPYLEKYLKQFKPTRWLFEGHYGGKYSDASLQKIFEKALKYSKVNPYATLHTLRHSYATHCIENGHHIKQVQDALGHNSIKTTEIYLHISSDALKKLQSPLDKLKLK